MKVVRRGKAPDHPLVGTRHICQKCTTVIEIEPADLETRGKNFDPLRYQVCPVCKGEIVLNQPEEEV